MQLAESRRDVRLALFGVLIFRVFRKIAMCARLHQLLGQFVMQLVLESFDFFTKLMAYFVSNFIHFARSRLSVEECEESPAACVEATFVSIEDLFLLLQTWRL